MTTYASYALALTEALGSVVTTLGSTDRYATIPMDPALDSVRVKPQSKLIFIGNGGSAAIASHMAIDFTKNGHIRAIAFNDPIALTCLENDFAHDKVFSTFLDSYADKDDVLIAISSSGQSENIRAAVRYARVEGMKTVTLSGFDENNPLRKLGSINFYVPSKVYGIVETVHQAILHSCLDIGMGWTYGADQPTKAFT